jgi:hypothetical protein
MATWTCSVEFFVEYQICCDPEPEPEAEPASPEADESPPDPHAASVIVIAATAASAVIFLRMFNFFPGLMVVAF